MKFELDEYEQKKFAAWWDAHKKEHHDGQPPYAGAIGGAVSYVITPTGIGDLLGVQCNTCKHQVVADRVLGALNQSDIEDRYHVTLTNYEEL